MTTNFHKLKKLVENHLENIKQYSVTDDENGDYENINDTINSLVHVQSVIDACIIVEKDDEYFNSSEFWMSVLMYTTIEFNDDDRDDSSVTHDSRKGYPLDSSCMRMMLKFCEVFLGKKRMNQIIDGL